MRTLGISRACADRTGPGFGYRYHVIFVQQEMIGKPDAIKTGFFSLRAKRSSRHSPLRVGPETKPQSTSVLVNSQKKCYSPNNKGSNKLDRGLESRNCPKICRNDSRLNDSRLKEAALDAKKRAQAEGLNRHREGRCAQRLLTVLTPIKGRF